MKGDRKIFEEVSGDGPKPESARPGLIDAGRDRSMARVRIWLAVLLWLVVLTILIGALTRLTDSGLSITEWKPVTGLIPPLGPEAWALEFEKYKAVPEYSLQNSQMTLGQFKVIYWWEWGHRAIARAVGLVWILGLAWLVFAGDVPRGRIWGLALPGLLGALQALAGWWMVQSGLSGRVVDVAPYRLAIHLGLAFAILAALRWQMLMFGKSAADLMRSRRMGESRLVAHAAALAALVFIQILLGALVAGSGAGQGYRDWPLMNGEFFPSGALGYSPLYVNFFENPALVQFNHRMGAYLALAVAAAFWWRSRSSPFREVRAAAAMAAAAILAQALVGIATLAMGASFYVALLHHAMAIAVFALAVKLLFRVVYPAADSLRGNDNA